MIISVEMESGEPVIKVPKSWDKSPVVMMKAFFGVLPYFLQLGYSLYDDLTSLLLKKGGPV